VAELHWKEEAPQNRTRDKDSTQNTAEEELEMGEFNISEEAAFRNIAEARRPGTLPPLPHVNRKKT
jgi:hypothetical protein